jgi:hypothetical protein
MSAKLSEAYQEVAREADQPAQANHHISLKDTKRVIYEYHRYLSHLPAEEAMSLVAKGIASARRKEALESLTGPKGQSAKVS